MYIWHLDAAIKLLTIILYQSLVDADMILDEDPKKLAFRKSRSIEYRW